MVRLFLILLKILLITPSWYPISFITCFILAFFGYVIFIGDNGMCFMKQGGNNILLATCLVVRAIVQVLASLSKLPLYHYRDLSIISFYLSVKKLQFPITFFLHCKLPHCKLPFSIVLMKIVDVIEKVFQVRTYQVVVTHSSKSD